MIRVLILNTLIWGIISGIVSSGIIYVLVFKIKPTVEVGNKIAKSYEDGKIIYRIKIINKSRFAIFNLKYSLHYCNAQTDGIVQIREIEPFKKPLFFVSSACKKDMNDKHAVRISYLIDDEFEFCEGAYLKFTLIATHGFTNTSTYIEKKFDKDSIIEGRFETGNSLKVLEN